MGSPLALEVRDVRKHWPSAPAPVLDDVTLEVARGQCVAVTGANGAGKTTLLRIAAGLITPDAGDVRIHGLDLERDRTACQRHIGFLSAGNTGLYGRLDVALHLDYWARLAMIPRARREQAKAAVAERFALAELSGRRVDRLSMGQRQRVRLALSFLHAPDLLLLDEPRTSLDDAGVGLLREAVLERVRAGGAAIVCSPTVEDAGLAYDRVHIVREGGLVAA